MYVISPFKDNPGNSPCHVARAGVGDWLQHGEAPGKSVGVLSFNAAPREAGWAQFNQRAAELHIQVSMSLLFSVETFSYRLV